MYFILMMRVYTQLNVYMWMYLRNSRIVLMILVKSSVGKQGRKVLAIYVNPSGPHPFPRLLHRHQKTHTHTHKHTHPYTNHQMPYAQHPREDLQTVVSKQTNPNLQQ